MDISDDSPPLWTGAIAKCHKGERLLKPFHVAISQVGSPRIRSLCSPPNQLNIKGTAPVRKIYDFVKKTVLVGSKKKSVILKIRPLNASVAKEYTEFCSYLQGPCEAKQMCAVIHFNESLVLYLLPPDTNLVSNKFMQKSFKCSKPEEAFCDPNSSPKNVSRPTSATDPRSEDVKKHPRRPSVVSFATQTSIINPTVYSPSVSDKPMSDTPVSDTRVSDTWVSEKLVSDTRVLDKSVADTRVSVKDVSGKPVSDKLVSDTRVSKQPASGEMLSEKSVSEKPSGKSVSAKILRSVPALEKPVAKKPVSHKYISEKPVSQKRISEKPVSLLSPLKSHVVPPVRRSRSESSVASPDPSKWGNVSPPVRKSKPTLRKIARSQRLVSRKSPVGLSWPGKSPGVTGIYPKPTRPVSDLKSSRTVVYGRQTFSVKSSVGCLSRSPTTRLHGTGISPVSSKHIFRGDIGRPAAKPLVMINRKNKNKSSKVVKSGRKQSDRESTGSEFRETAVQPTLSDIRQSAFSGRSGILTDKSFDASELSGSESSVTIDSTGSESAETPKRRSIGHSLSVPGNDCVSVPGNDCISVSESSCISVSGMEKYACDSNIQSTVCSLQSVDKPAISHVSDREKKSEKPSPISVSNSVSKIAEPDLVSVCENECAPVSENYCISASTNDDTSVSENDSSKYPSDIQRTSLPSDDTPVTSTTSNCTNSGQKPSECSANQTLPVSNQTLPVANRTLSVSNSVSPIDSHDIPVGDIFEDSPLKTSVCSNQLSSAKPVNTVSEKENVQRLPNERFGVSVAPTDSMSILASETLSTTEHAPKDKMSETDDLLRCDELYLSDGSTESVNRHASVCDTLSGEINSEIVSTASTDHSQVVTLSPALATDYDDSKHVISSSSQPKSQGNCGEVQINQKSATLSESADHQISDFDDLYVSGSSGDEISPNNNRTDDQTSQNRVSRRTRSHKSSSGATKLKRREPLKGKTISKKRNRPEKPDD
eukprot:132766_1